MRNPRPPQKREKRIDAGMIGPSYLTCRESSTNPGCSMARQCGQSSRGGSQSSLTRSGRQGNSPPVSYNWEWLRLWRRPFSLLVRQTLWSPRGPVQESARPHDRPSLPQGGLALSLGPAATPNTPAPSASPAWGADLKHLPNKHKARGALSAAMIWPQAELSWVGLGWVGGVSLGIRRTRVVPTDLAPSLKNMGGRDQMRNGIFIGLDVHKALISVAVALGERRVPALMHDRPIAQTKCESWTRNWALAAADFCYEAGPCGYVNRCRFR